MCRIDTESRVRNLQRKNGRPHTAKRRLVITVPQTSHCSEHQESRTGLLYPIRLHCIVKRRQQEWLRKHEETHLDTGPYDMIKTNGHKYTQRRGHRVAEENCNATNAANCEVSHQKAICLIEVLSLNVLHLPNLTLGGTMLRNGEEGR